MFRFVVFALVLSISSLAPSSGHSAVGTGGVRLLHADSQGASFEVMTDPGAPGVAARTVWVGVPDGASIEVAASVLESHPLAAATGEAAPLAVVKSVGWMRAQRVAAIVIDPVRRDGVSGRSEIASRVAVQVAFAGRPATRASATDPSFENVYRDLLVNYESARGFRRLLPWARSSGPRDVPDFDAAGTWVRIGVATKGIQELRGSAIEAAGVPLAGISPDAIRLYTWRGVPVLPESSFCDSCGLAEVAIKIEGGEDGRLDPGDRIVFYGVGPSAWRDDFTGPDGGSNEWFDNQYETRHVYWLALDAKAAATPARWSTRDVTPSGGATPAATYPARLHFEANTEYQPGLYERGFPWDMWAWQTLSSFQGPVAVEADCDGAVEGAPARLRARLFSRPSSGGSANHRVDATFNDQVLAPLNWSGPRHSDFDTTTTHVVDGLNRLTLSVTSQPGDFVSFLFWELHFDRRFLAVKDTLEFASAAAGGARLYTVAPFTAPATLLDVTDPLRPVELVGGQRTDTLTFEDDRVGASYFAATDTARLVPALERAGIRDIRHGGADYVVICSDALEGDAQRLAAHRNAFPPFPGATTAVVRMSDILAWYSGGHMDPVAIRNFLHDAVAGGGWTPAPGTVCFLGDASFDYRNVYHLGEPDLNRTQVPTFQRNYETEQYPSDDWLADIDGSEDDANAGGVPDLIIGRLPAANQNEARVLVDKAVSYEATPEYGPWRNRTLSLVDDVMQGNQPDPVGGTFIQNADSLEHANLPSFLDRTKVELIEYPFTQGTSKDGARQEVLRQLQGGAVFWHYVGRGNLFKLADENAFLRDDAYGMRNLSRLPFFFASTSAAGPFDSPIVESMAEALVKKEGGGTIASYAATINTFAFANFQLAEELYDALLYPPELGGGRTIGEASFVAKHRDFASQNDRKYHVLGDPGTRLAIPRDDVRFRVFDFESGEEFTDSIPTGRKLRLQGRVYDSRGPSGGAFVSGLAGTASVRVTDAPVRVDVPSSFGFTGYDANPRTAYQLEIPFQSGAFETGITIPAEAHLGSRARLSAYIAGQGTDGSGAYVTRLVQGVPDPSDSTGPTFDMRFAGGGNIMGPSEPFRLTIADPSGIRTFDDSPLDRILVTFDDLAPLDLTADFHYETGSSTQGTLAFVVPLGDGPHTITVSASDNLADSATRARHRSQATFPFRIAAAVQAGSPRAYVLPNPFVAAAGADLVFAGIGRPSRCEVGVYDVRGRLLRRLEGKSVDAHVQVRWDGRDTAGVPVAAGIYLYRAAVVPDAGAELRFNGRLVLLK